MKNIAAYQIIGIIKTTNAPPLLIGVQDFRAY